MRSVPRVSVRVSGAVSEGGHHVPPALGHCPAVLPPCSRALKPALSPRVVHVKGEHLLQVLKHVIKESSSEAPLLSLPPLPVHSLLVGLEVAVKMSLLVGLVLGVKVVLVWLLVAEEVKVFEDVVKVERLEVLVEVVVSTTCSSVALP